VLLPDLLGMTVEEVQQITTQSTLALEVSGSGRAVAQDPPPGTIVASGSTRIRVRFETSPLRSAGGEG
jgi:stage V sporulation protein D (sporulation-specific penicillin-binding protein)